jgi:hypothetical protein
MPEALLASGAREPGAGCLLAGCRPAGGQDLPGLRPERPRSDRSRGFFSYGLSEEGGLDDVEESLPGRRSSSSTRAASASARTPGHSGMNSYPIIGRDHFPFGLNPIQSGRN